MHCLDESALYILFIEMGFQSAHIETFLRDNAKNVITVLL